MVKLVFSVSLLSLLTEHGQPQLHSASGDSVSREDVAHSNSCLLAFHRIRFAPQERPVGRCY